MEDPENGVFVCMTGEQFRQRISGVVYTQGEDLSCEIMNIAAFRRIHKSLKVLTQATSHDKLLLIDGLKKINKNVAVTGGSADDA